MKNWLLILLLIPATGYGQQWKQCVREQKFIFAQSGDGVTKNTGITFCSNETSFSIFDKDEKKVFPIANYEQQSSDNGALEETFSNGKTETNAEGDYSITITHGNPATITIQYNKDDGGMWYVTTKNIAPVRKPEVDTDK